MPHLKELHSDTFKSIITSFLNAETKQHAQMIVASLKGYDFIKPAKQLNYYGLYSDGCSNETDLIDFTLGVNNSGLGLPKFIYNHTFNCFAWASEEGYDLKELSESYDFNIHGSGAIINILEDIKD